MNTQNFPTRASMLFHFLRGNKRYFLLSMIFAALVSLFDLINPQIISYTVDTVLDGEESTMPAWVDRVVMEIGGVSYLRAHLYVIALVVIGVALMGALFRFLFKTCNSIGAETLIKRMRDLLQEHIIHLPFTWHNANHTGDIIQRCTSDVEEIKTFLAEHLSNLIRIVVMILLAISFMLRIDTVLTAVSCAFFPIVILYSFFFHNKIGSRFERADMLEGKLSAIAQENLTGVRVVRAFGREQYEREHFEEANQVYTESWLKLMHLLSMFWASGDLITGLQVMLIVVIGAVRVIHGELLLGEYIAFISYNAMLTWPVRMLGRVISEMSKAGISIDRIRYIMNAEVEKNQDETFTPPMNGDIKFEHVSFSYGEHSPEVLEDIDFTIKAGTTVGILGGTGSGKSTLMYLLDRLYNISPEQGHIYIGGMDIQRMPMEHLRKNIGMVLQEPFLFSRTLADNIAITRDSLDMKEVRRASKIAMLDDSINKFARGYETYVGERGVTLSGGQKQRAAIAQMLIRKPPIMVFDDSLSAVDAETDAKIRKALDTQTGESTVILIAHRITTLMKADQILVMDHGRIIERGTHEELLAAGGSYSRIYALQSADAM
ncbi:MAG: ABC transporter ATP-binding protein/permease [Lachnospiraceae bacterium]|nr:ABC transporter ATP-binding protein/permease [Lachnospiraceae bacterium]